MVNENLYGVSKRQWKKWNEQERKLFNDLFSSMMFEQRIFLHPEAVARSDKHWKTTAWNAAYLAADYLRMARKANE